MAADDASTPEAEAPKPFDTLSQFVARVLSQLSLAAWLPSTALVLSLDFVAQLGAVLDAGKQHGPAAAGAAFTDISKAGFGGALLLIATVVVLTMLTQAFSLEAIRTLEGYWGTWRIAEQLAQWRCGKHRRSLKRLLKIRAELNEAAWAGTKAEINKLRRRSRRRGQGDQFTADMVSVLGSWILDKNTDVTLAPAEEEFLRSFGWQAYAPPDPMRRRVNLDRRLRDYPDENRILPTRLGNILRAHEDQTGRSQVRTFIQEVFDMLPPALRTEHDEQRVRLDLYCSMVFVLAFTGIVAIVRLAAHHWPYAVAVFATATTGMYVMYGAALATARSYGSLLVTIAAKVRVLGIPQGSSG